MMRSQSNFEEELGIKVNQSSDIFGLQRPKGNSHHVKRQNTRITQKREMGTINTSSRGIDDIQVTSFPM